MDTSDHEWVKDCKYWYGETLRGEFAHWCWDWDGLPIDETCQEFCSCTCYDTTPEIEQLIKTLWENYGEKADLSDFGFTEVIRGGIQQD